jgi:hypothetical protein
VLGVGVEWAFRVSVILSGSLVVLSANKKLTTRADGFRFALDLGANRSTLHDISRPE